MMPSMSGLEVCRILRERYSPTQLPIVLVSGKSSKESIVEGLAAGANDYVTKPFDSAELLSRVKGQLMAAAMAKAEVQDAGTETIHRKMLPPAILRSWEARPAGEEVAEELEHASVLCAAIEGPVLPCPSSGGTRAGGCLSGGSERERGSEREIGRWCCAAAPRALGREHTVWG
eukprot:3665837-Rhodomonas_salina.2